MDARIFRINYKSDFILTLKCDAGWATPFCIKFWTGAPSLAYYAQYDGETFTHCSLDPDDPTKLTVQFDDHHLPIGNLKFQIAYHFTSDDFPDGEESEVTNTESVIIEVDGVEQQVMLDFTGDMTAEIQFNLPAMQAEEQRQRNEVQRIANEEEREREFAQMQQENAQAVEGAENVNATLNGTVLTVTNRNGQSTSSDVRGPQGIQGVPGSAATIAVGTVTTGAAGSQAAVNNSGTSSAAVLDFTIPRGDQGIQGETGPQGVPGTAATITVGTVTTGAAGSQAAVNNIGTSSAAVLDFTIPRGDKGIQGETGPQGVPGNAATIAVGTVTTGAAGSQAAVNNSGTSSAAVLDFTIPRGDQGIQGETGPQGPQGIQGVAGYSAYQIAVQHGYTGTEAEYNQLYFDAVQHAENCNITLTNDTVVTVTNHLGQSSSFDLINEIGDLKSILDDINGEVI